MLVLLGKARNAAGCDLAGDLESAIVRGIRIVSHGRLDNWDVHNSAFVDETCGFHEHLVHLVQGRQGRAITSVAESAARRQN
jgi:hypothetical protein